MIFGWPSFRLMQLPLLKQCSRANTLGCTHLAWKHCQNWQNMVWVSFWLMYISWLVCRNFPQWCDGLAAIDCWIGFLFICKQFWSLDSLDLLLTQVKLSLNFVIWHVLKSVPSFQCFFLYHFYILIVKNLYHLSFLWAMKKCNATTSPAKQYLCNICYNHMPHSHIITWSHQSLLTLHSDPKWSCDSPWSHVQVYTHLNCTPDPDKLCYILVIHSDSTCSHTHA